MAPELGQIMFHPEKIGDYEMPEHAVALFMYIRDELVRVHGNMYQTEWNDAERPPDRFVPGLVWRPFYWGDDVAEGEKPNFTFGEVEIRWYKRPGRGMTCNVEWDPARWALWFGECLKAIRKVDPASDENLMAASIVKQATEEK